MKQRSLFRKYFFASTGLILLTIGFLGVVFLSFASQYFQNDRFSTLHQNAVYALEATEKFCVNVDGTYKVSSALDDVYIPIAKAIDADIFLTNVNGNTLICTGQETCSHRTRPIPSDILTTVGEELSYQGITDLGGIYQSKHYTVALPLIVGDQQIAGMVFVASDAGDLTDFLKEMLEMFLVSAICVIIIAFAVIYVISSNMVRPLRSMVSATESFARGDFTVRVPVTEMDEIGKLSMAFNNMATSLAQQDSIRRSFVANVSHELKTPMTTIGGFVDGIMDGTIPPEKQRHYLSIVSSEVKRLSRLVRSMLNIARLESGEMQLQPKDFDINQVVCSTIFTFEQSIEEKQLDIRGLDADRIMVSADEDLIHQVVYNLVENAVKFVNTGGFIEISYHNEANMTHISVKNSGEGISKEEISKVFERFYKTDRSRSQDKSGVGLGLNIVRSIVKLHGGEVIVRSTEGQFCEFTFTLPTANIKQNSRHTAPIPPIPENLK